MATYEAALWVEAQTGTRVNEEAAVAQFVASLLETAQLQADAFLNDASLSEGQLLSVQSDAIPEGVNGGVGQAFDQVYERFGVAPPPSGMFRPWTRLASAHGAWSDATPASGGWMSNVVTVQPGSGIRIFDTIVARDGDWSRKVYGSRANMYKPPWRPQSLLFLQSLGRLIRSDDWSPRPGKSYGTKDRQA